MKNITNDYRDWREMIELIPKMQNAVKIGLIRHISHCHNHHQPKHIENEIELLKDGFNLFQGKYTLEILFVLSGMKNPFFNEIKTALSNINPGTLSKRLKLLEQKKIIERHIHNGQPIRVSYNLTEMGEGVFNLLVPVLVFFSFPFIA